MRWGWTRPASRASDNQSSVQHQPQVLWGKVRSAKNRPQLLSANSSWELILGKASLFTLIRPVVVSNLDKLMETIMWVGVILEKRRAMDLASDLDKVRLEGRLICRQNRSNLSPKTRISISWVIPQTSKVANREEQSELKQLTLASPNRPRMESIFRLESKLVSPKITLQRIVNENRRKMSCLLTSKSTKSSLVRNKVWEWCLRETQACSKFTWTVTELTTRLSRKLPQTLISYKIRLRSQLNPLMIPLNSTLQETRTPTWSWPNHPCKICKKISNIVVVI